MTHQNHQTNGASLEDCHTNFFALTELYGIKWRKLVWGETSGGGEGGEGGAPLADPVISSYARCLAGDILCVWRRVPQPQQTNDIYEVSAPAPPPPLSLRAAKELWIFWYGEEPDLNGLVAPELIASQGDQGSWESGLSYECRSLLFKALHNLIERCLLSRDFVRLGKWFVQPYDGDEEDVGKSPWHLSFSFAFFLHGESTVCASVDVRQHPPVRTLTPARLAALARASRHRQNADKANNKVILAPYGLEGVVTGRSWGEGDAPTARLLDAWRQLYPLEQGCSAVEVICSDVRMRYPVPYVLVTEMEAGGGGAAGGGPPAHPPAPPAPHPLAHHALAALATPAPHQPPEVCYAEAHADKEDFCDPTRKTPCTCAKWRRRRVRPPPFHRRPAPAHKPPPPHRTHPATAPAPAPLSVGLCGGLTVSGAALAGGGPGGGVSPCSAAPSPAPPASAPPSAGPPPPSPHPQQTTTNGASCTAVGSAGSAVPPSLHTPAPTPDPLAPPTPAPPPANPPKPQTQGDSPTGGGEAVKSEGGAEWWRRPLLPAPPPAPDPPEDDHALHMLYDYTTVHAWLEHPVKRFKGEESGFVEEMALGAGALDDLYLGHEHTKMAATPDYRLQDIKQEKQEDEKEYKNLFTSDGLCPTLKDLEQIFDNSDDAASGDETVRLLQTQAGGEWKCEDGRGGGAGGAGCAGGRCVRAEELSKMFPTPPSLEAHAQPSPGFTLPDDATPQPHRMHAGSPPPDPIEDWSYVFKPPTVYKYVGSSKYAPLTQLPSQLLPPVTLPPHAVYRPRAPHPPPAPPPPPPQLDQTGTQQDATPNRTGIKRSGSPLPTEPLKPRSQQPRTPAMDARPPCPPCPPSPPSPLRRAAAHACPLLVNVLLADTVLNVFRDHNFDSCTLCVCNAGPKVVGNIRGADYATYLCGASGTDDDAGGDDEPSRCTCGFSAILNRRLAHRAGLFYEDEMEITGLAEEPTLNSSPAGGGLAEVAGIVVAQCAALAGGPASALARAARRAAHSRKHDHLRLNLLEFSDGGAAAVRALRAAAGGPCSAVAVPGGPAAAGGGTVHRWPFIGARAPRSSRDVVRLMRRLRPLLQDAIQKRCCGARMWDGVTGPLTWRQFHRLAGRGNEDLCEPQPVPPVVVGHDRDWVSVSPYALRHWERLALEPYSYARDVAYVVVAADGDVLTDPLRTFFRELSATYEACRLGRHQPLQRVARDGIVRAATGDAPRDDDWAGPAPPGRLGEYIRAYAETLRTHVVPQLATFAVDRTLFEQDRERERERERERVPASPMRPPSTPDHPATPSSQGEPDEQNTSSGSNSGGGVAGGGSAAPPAPDEGGAALVIYLVEPPAAAAARPHALMALLRLAARTHQHLQHHNPLIKIISLEGVCESWRGGGGWARRALALSVFTAARRTLTHKPTGKSLTGFGTAANDALFLSNKDEKNRLGYAMFSPAWVLGVSRCRGRDLGENWLSAGGSEQPPVLFVAYCLSHDQRWLLAAATDARGELLDTAIINVHVPPRCRRGSGGGGLARRLGLTKLMDFTLGVMSQAAQPWRLVVGRVGRIGHGELKGWSWLLSRKNLTRASTVLREICNSCSVLYPSGVPCILSACLVSTEPDSCLRLMADRFTPDERFSQASIQSHLHTPRDVTATHILVFPTSATTQSNQMPFEPPMANGEDNDMMFLGVDMDEDMGEDNMTDLLMGDMLFGNMWAPGSPRRHDEENSRDGSPASARHAQHPNAAMAHDQQAEQVGTVLQQPLALGYLVSTAPLAGMPAWWWAGCSHLRDACPAFLKNALHLHAGNVQSADDLASFTSQRRDHNVHPLDSQTTTDVLRYVLEGYNALSWLSVDGTTHDRISCLPFHVQVLMQLYHTAAALG